MCLFTLPQTSINADATPSTITESGDMEFPTENYNYNPNFQCAECNKSFQTKESFEEHRKIHLESVRIDESQAIYKCGQCGKELTSKDDLLSHMSRVHVEKESEKPRRNMTRKVTVEKRRRSLSLLKHKGKKRA